MKHHIALVCILATTACAPQRDAIFLTAAPDQQSMVRDGGERGRAGVHQLAGRAGADRPPRRQPVQAGHRERIGAATGIEFLGHGRYLAAAEPVRRGSGSAAVVSKR